MATNPPITIGEVATVPAPGSGVSSAFHQTITRRVAHRFATAAARDAAYPAAGAGAGALAYTTDAKTLWLSDGATWLATVTGVTAWAAAALNPPWVNVGTVYRTARYRKIGDVVYIEGMVKTGTINSIVFNLPAGFRPPLQINFPTSSQGIYGQLSITQSGDFYVQIGQPAQSVDINCSFSTL